MTEQVAEKIMAKVRELPPLPEVVTQLMVVLRQPLVDYARVEELIRHDPALSGRLLQLANSSFFGLANRISSVHDACMVLGAATINRIVLAVAVRERFPATSGGVIDRKKLWKHAMGVAASAAVLATETGSDKEAAFTAGLLHNLGRLALDTCFLEVYEKVGHYQQDNGCMLDVAEQKILGVNHRYVGRRMAERWQLPLELVRVIAGYATPDNGETDPMTDLVHIADVLAQALGIGDSGNPRVPLLAEGAWNRTGISWERLRELLPEIEKRVAEDPFSQSG